MRAAAFVPRQVRAGNRNSVGFISNRRRRREQRLSPTIRQLFAKLRDLVGEGGDSAISHLLLERWRRLSPREGVRHEVGLRGRSKQPAAAKALGPELLGLQEEGLVLRIDCILRSTQVLHCLLRLLPKHALEIGGLLELRPLLAEFRTQAVQLRLRIRLLRAQLVASALEFGPHLPLEVVGHIGPKGCGPIAEEHIGDNPAARSLSPGTPGRRRDGQTKVHGARPRTLGLVDLVPAVQGSLQLRHPPA
mmetsp:Transcript_33339/g.95650  ORF Transcript_33339/g.95650 Transcript_33339/m.95650 type:complete len:248 (+) Transcript_33339:751-1494(+)